MTDELAERIATALEQIAYNLSDDGPLAEHLAGLLERLEEVTPADGSGRRFLRTMDVGRD